MVKGSKGLMEKKIDIDDLSKVSGGSMYISPKEQEQQQQEPPACPDVRKESPILDWVDDILNSKP